MCDLMRDMGRKARNSSTKEGLNKITGQPRNVVDTGNAIAAEVLLDADAKIIESLLHDPIVKKAYIRTLLDSGCTYKQIMSVCKCSPQLVSEVAKTKREIDELDSSLQRALASSEMKRLSTIRSKILARIGDDKVINDAGLSQLVYAYSMLLDKQRLLEDKSTSNIAVLVKSIQDDFKKEANEMTDILENFKKTGDVNNVEIKAEDIDESAEF